MPDPHKWMIYPLCRPTLQHFNTFDQCSTLHFSLAAWFQFWERLSLIYSWLNVQTSVFQLYIISSQERPLFLYLLNLRQNRMEISNIKIRWNLYKSHSERVSEKSQFRKIIFQLRDSFLHFIALWFVLKIAHNMQNLGSCWERCWRLTAAQLC